MFGRKAVYRHACASLGMPPRHWGVAVVTASSQPWTTGAAPASDGYSLGFRKYESANANGPVVACIHGIQSHSGWYEKSCRFYADSGFTTYFFDRRGSGMNADDRG